MRGRHRSSEEVDRRLARIEGHVSGIRRMLGENKDCPDLLVQIAAVRRALDEVGRILLEDHMETCVVRAVREGAGQKAITDLKDALAKFI